MGEDVRAAAHVGIDQGRHAVDHGRGIDLVPAQRLPLEDASEIAAMDRQKTLPGADKQELVFGTWVLERGETCDHRRPWLVVPIRTCDFAILTRCVSEDPRAAFVARNTPADKFPPGNDPSARRPDQRPARRRTAVEALANSVHARGWRTAMRWQPACRCAQVGEPASGQRIASREERSVPGG